MQFERTRELSNFFVALHYLHDMFVHVFLKITLIISFFSWNHVCNLGVLLISQVWLIHMFSIFLRRTVGKQSYQLLYHSTSHQFLVSKSVIRTVNQTNQPVRIIFKIQTTLEFRFWEVGIWIVCQSVGKSVMQSHTNINSYVCLSCLTLKLTQVTKTDFLLTVPIKYQTSKWWD